MTIINKTNIRCDFCQEIGTWANGKWNRRMIENEHMNNDTHICTNCIKQCERILLTNTKPDQSIIPFNQIKPVEGA